MVALSEYDWHIQYKPGKDHTNADGLSRMPRDHDEPSSDTSVVREDVYTFCGAVDIYPSYSVAEISALQAADDTLHAVLLQFPAGRPHLSGLWKSDSNYAAFGPSGLN